MEGTMYLLVMVLMVLIHCITHIHECGQHLCQHSLKVLLDLCMLWTKRCAKLGSLACSAT